MRALRVHALIGPAGLRLDTLDAPTPGEGQVLVDVKAAGVNFPDVLLSYGKYQLKPEAPFIPGGEIAGVVSAIGPGVTNVRVGTKVAAWMIAGGFAEKVVVEASSVIEVPDPISFETAAITLLTYGTTYHALVDRAAIKNGETLLVLGAAGGVGVAAIQLGKVLGAKVIAAASTPEKLAFCRSMGADEGIDYAKEDLKERIKKLTGGDGANVIYDAVGGPYSEPALRAIAWEGRHLVVGFAAGEIPKVPLNLTLLKGCQVVGVFWGSFVAREPARHAANSAQIFRWVVEGKLRPHLDAALPFSQGAEALLRLEQRKVLGKIALVP